MPDHVSIHTIIAHVVPSYDYDRMVDSDCSGIDTTKSYAEFLDWNQTCLNAMTDADITWLMGLCTRLKGRTIKLMDMEPCSVFTADAIYFDKQANLCIVNPR